MVIFISWSKPLSQQIAGILYSSIGNIFPSTCKINLFMSTEDIQSGARWFSEISRKLEDSDFGILILTHENYNAPWLHFEAGALSKSITESKVCPILVNIANRDIIGPLSQFHCSSILKEDMLKLFKSINKANESELQLDENWLERTFNLYWPQLDIDFKEIERKYDCNNDGIPELSPTDRLLDEVLQHVRSISLQIKNPSINTIEKSETREGCLSSLSDSMNLINDYREEISILKSFKHAGISSFYKNRKLGIKAFHDSVDKAKKKIFIIGSSLKGLLQDTDYHEFAELIKKKAFQSGMELRFLLTHPCVADFRAKQEKRNPNEIGQEVIDSLIILQKWGISEKYIKL